MSSTPIRVGIVGAGQNTTSKHIPGLRALPEVEIVSVCNRSRASSERVASAHNIPTVYNDWRALVDAPDTNAIVIGTWPTLHAPVTLAALAADKHVLCEARMAMNASEAHAMHAAARARPHLTAQIVPSPFSLGVDRAIKRLIADGFLGDILAIRVRDTGGWLDRDEPLHWRHDADLSGLNVMSLGIWYEAVLRWAGEATRVTAFGGTVVKQRTDPANGELRAVRIPDQLEVSAEMACGALAHFWITRVAGLAGPNEAVLYGSEGALRFSEGRLTGGQRGDDTLTEIAIPPEEAGGWRVEEEFANAIRGLEPVQHTTFADGVKYMQFTEAVARSLAEGRAIPLPLI